jgi:hypothetical protein
MAVETLIDRPVGDEGPDDTNKAGVGVGVPDQLPPDHDQDKPRHHARRRHRGRPHLAVVLGVELGGRVRPELGQGRPAVVGAVLILGPAEIVPAVLIVGLGSCSRTNKKMFKLLLQLAISHPPIHKSKHLKLLKPPDAKQSLVFTKIQLPSSRWFLVRRRQHTTRIAWSQPTRSVR